MSQYSEDELREVIERLLYQFAYNGAPRNGNPTLWTGGLSALEDAFDVMNWNDPHEIPDSRCDEPGCVARSSCGWPSPSGYRRTCFDHSDMKRSK